MTDEEWVEWFEEFRAALTRGSTAAVAGDVAAMEYWHERSRELLRLAQARIGA